MRGLAILFLLLASCSKGPDADLPAIGEARSLAAEWSLLNQLASEGRLTASYERTMHDAVRKQLQTTAESLTHPHSRYAQEIAALRREPDNADPQKLSLHADNLKEIEDSLESA